MAPTLLVRVTWLGCRLGHRRGRVSWVCRWIDNIATVAYHGHSEVMCRWSNFSDATYTLAKHGLAGGER